MASYAVKAASEAGAKKNVMVVGFGADKVREAFGESVCYADQPETVGTSDAVRTRAAILSRRTRMCSFCRATRR